MNSKLTFLIKEPKIKKDKNPLLLLLHGHGSNEADLFSFASELPEEYYVISARAPYDLGYGSYTWYAINFDADQNKFSNNDQAKVSIDLIRNFIDELIENYPIDAANISLIGFSQGAILSYGIGLSYPAKIKSIIGLSGYINESILATNYANNDFSKLNIFTAHGTVDQVIPVEWARKSNTLLNSLNISHSYKEYPIGHGISPQVFYDFKNWMKDN